MENNWPDNLTIQQYLDGSLDKKLMHELEKRALEDPFLADALEGYSNTTASDHGLSILQRQLHERISHQQENKKVFDLSWQRLSVAAAAAVMFISAGVLFWMNSQLSDQKSASIPKRVEVNITPIDSLNNDGAIVTTPPIKNEEIKKAEVRASKTAQYSVRPTVKSRAANRPYTSLKSDAGLLNKSEITFIEDKHAGILSAKRPKKVEGLSLRDSAIIAAMNSSTEPLSEVVVTSSAVDSQRKAMAANEIVVYKTYAKENAFKASPTGGWESYRIYLKESIARTATSLKQRGKVIIGFTVNQQGVLSDFKILKPLSANADSLAIQLIKNGPTWKTDPDVKVAGLSVELDF